MFPEHPRHSPTSGPLHLPPFAGKLSPWGHGGLIPLLNGGVRIPALIPRSPHAMQVPCLGFGFSLSLTPPLLQ